MRLTNCSDVEPQLWRYVDRELSATELAAVSAHLRTCEPCRAIYHERSRESRLYRGAFARSPFGEKFVRSCMEGVRKKGLLRSAEPRRSMLPVGRFRSLTMVGALLLVPPVLVVLAVLFVQPRSLGSFEAKGEALRTGSIGADGGYRFHEGRIPQRGPCLAGSVFEVPEDSELIIGIGRTPGGDSVSAATTCRLRGPGLLALSPAARGGTFRATLESGMLQASVAKLQPGETFLIETPHASVSVVGTRFSLKVLGDATTLWVEEGSVAFEASPGPEGARAAPSRRVVDATEGPWIVRRGAAGPVPLESASVGVEAADAGAPAVASPDGGQAAEAQVPAPEPPAGAQPSEPLDGVSPDFKAGLDRTVDPEAEGERSGEPPTNGGEKKP